MSLTLIRLANEHRRVLNNAANLAVRETETALRIATRRNDPSGYGLLRESIPVILATYGSVVDTLDEDYYTNLRDRANVSTSYTPSASPKDWERVASPISGFAIQRTIEQQALAATVSLITGTIAAELFNQHRENIGFNAGRDPSPVEYKRITRPGACDFCMYMATGFEGDGSNSDYKNFHAGCRCVDVPIFQGQDFREPAYYQEFRQDTATARSRIEEARRAARAANPGMRDRDFFRKYPDLALTTPNIVKEVRRVKLGQPNNFTI